MADLEGERFRGENELPCDHDEAEHFDDKLTKHRQARSVIVRALGDYTRRAFANCSKPTEMFVKLTDP